MKIKLFIATVIIVACNVFATSPDFDFDNAFKEYCKRKHEDKLHPVISFAHELRYRCEFARAHHFLDNHVIDRSELTPLDIETIRAFAGAAVFHQWIPKQSWFRDAFDQSPIISGKISPEMLRVQKGQMKKKVTQPPICIAFCKNQKHL